MYPNFTLTTGTSIVSVLPNNLLNVVCGYKVFLNEDLPDGCGVDYLDDYGDDSFTAMEIEPNVIVTIEDEQPISITEAQGLLQSLWDKFGGTINSKGYKVIDSHISITYSGKLVIKLHKAISSRMKELGFSPNNLVMSLEKDQSKLTVKILPN